MLHNRTAMLFDALLEQFRSEGWNNFVPKSCTWAARS